LGLTESITLLTRKAILFFGFAAIHLLSLSHLGSECSGWLAVILLMDGSTVVAEIKENGVAVECGNTPYGFLCLSQIPFPALPAYFLASCNPSA
jgi:hypothetical protein